MQERVGVGRLYSYGLGMIAIHVNASMHPGGACMQNEM